MCHLLKNRVTQSVVVKNGLILECYSNEFTFLNIEQHFPFICPSLQRRWSFWGWWQSSTELMEVYKMTSSAYSLTIDSMFVGKSFMKQRNDSGTVPCGIPDVTQVVSLYSPLIITCWCLSVRKSFNKSKVLPWIPQSCNLW